MAEFYLIRASTLKGIANAIRTVEGSTEDILVKEFEARILEFLKGNTEPIKPKLNTPIIYISNDEPSDDVPVYDTPAILGRAILGRTILGKYVTLPKLDTPIIYLDVADSEEPDTPDDPVIVKLDRPVIYLTTEDEPDTPIEPEVRKLDTPIIHLVNDSTEGDSEINTPAILGRTILGRTILGKTSVLPKLGTPVIRLVVTDGEEPELIKLTAPTIRLEVVEDEPERVKLIAPNIYLDVVEEEPDAPEVIKLDTPTIYLDIIEDEIPDVPEEPEIVKLGTPVIRLETIDEPIPTIKLDAPIITLVIEEEEPEIVKLETPVITLEVIEDEIPDEPEIEKLNTPVIYLEDELTEIVLFEGDVVTETADMPTSSTSSMTINAFLADTHLLTPYTFGYTVSIDNVDYVLTWQRDGNVWADGAINVTVVLTQGVRGTGINSNVLGADGEIHHIKVYYKEGDLYLPKLETPEIYLETIEDEEPDNLNVVYDEVCTTSGDSIPISTISSARGNCVLIEGLTLTEGLDYIVTVDDLDYEFNYVGKNDYMSTSWEGDMIGGSKSMYNYNGNTIIHSGAMLGTAGETHRIKIAYKIT